MDDVMIIMQVVDIQPNDGFGVLLPLETIDLDVIFSAAKPKVVLGKSSCAWIVMEGLSVPLSLTGI